MRYFYYGIIMQINISTIPSPILYQPKGLKSCFLTKLISILMASIETAKAMIIPRSNAQISTDEKLPPSKINFKILNPLEPTIVGIARKKVNSDAVVLERPKISAPKIVTPDLDVPGTAARI